MTKQNIWKKSDSDSFYKTTYRKCHQLLCFEDLRVKRQRDSVLLNKHFIVFKVI